MPKKPDFSSFFGGSAVVAKKEPLLFCEWVCVGCEDVIYFFFL